MVTVDLGCGQDKRCDILFDLYPASTDVRKLNMGFEPIPLPDASVDRVFSTHSIEHVPFVVHYRAESSGAWAPYYPVLNLLREVCRILKRGGTFEILTLCGIGRPAHLDGPDERAWEDPTHQSVWTQGTINHFCGGRDSQRGDANDAAAGMRVPLQILENGLTADKLLRIVLVKP